MISKEDIKRYQKVLCLNDRVFRAALDTVDKINADEGLKNLADKMHNEIYIKRLPFNEVLSNIRKDTKVPAMFHAIIHIMNTPKTLEYYKNSKIPTDIFTSTVNDINLWAENHKKRRGEYGITESEWISFSFLPTLFKLGRLQFIFDHCLTSGEYIAEVHIPAGEALIIEECYKSIEAAKDFSEKVFGKKVTRFTCHSWMLAKNLDDMLGSTSNILKFRNMFTLLPDEMESKDILKFIFDDKDIDIYAAPVDTSLRANVVRHVKNGGKLYVGKGFING